MLENTLFVIVYDSCYVNCFTINSESESLCERDLSDEDCDILRVGKCKDLKYLSGWVKKYDYVVLIQNDDACLIKLKEELNKIKELEQTRENVLAELKKLLTYDKEKSELKWKYKQGDNYKFVKDSALDIVLNELFGKAKDGEL